MMRQNLVSMPSPWPLALACAALFAGPAPAAGGTPVAVPSGQEVTFVDTVSTAPGPDGLTLRFRFLAPAIARESGTVDAETAQADMQALCDGFAIPRLPETGPAPEHVVISLSDRAVAFGEPAPEATQYFESYTVIDGRCEWEPF